MRSSGNPKNTAETPRKCVPGDVLAEQREYYDQRAPEYEDWWYRRGLFDQGPAANERWFEEIREVEDALDRFAPRGKILELACGTGTWTRRLVRYADHLTAVDASAEVLALNRSRLEGEAITWLQADLFQWKPDSGYDVCFFGFWLSHVPEERFDAFWETVRAALNPGGRVFFLDSGKREEARTKPGDGISERRLADGRRFHIVKRFYEPAALEDALRDLGWTARVNSTTESFVYGCAAPAKRTRGLAL